MPVMYMCTNPHARICICRIYAGLYGQLYRHGVLLYGEPDGTTAPGMEGVTGRVPTPGDSVCITIHGRAGVFSFGLGFNNPWYRYRSQHVWGCGWFGPPRYQPAVQALGLEWRLLWQSRPINNRPVIRPNISL